MNRASRRTVSRMKPKNYMNISKVGSALQVINAEIVKFIRNILDDCGVNADKVYYKLNFIDMCYTISLCNSETGAIAGKSWALTEFMEMCSDKKIEFELNTVIRKLLLVIEEKRVTDANGNSVTVWI